MTSNDQQTSEPVHHSSAEADIEHQRAELEAILSAQREALLQQIAALREHNREGEADAEGVGRPRRPDDRGESTKVPVVWCLLQPA